jgi:hypothetical protein
VKPKHAANSLKNAITTYPALCKGDPAPPDHAGRVTITFISLPPSAESSVVAMAPGELFAVVVVLLVLV